MFYHNSNKNEVFVLKYASIVAFASIFVIWFFFTKNIRPDLTITKAPPGKHMLKLFSMGDDAFIYRHYGYQLQMSGDDYGTTTPLQNYDYPKLQKWFFLLNEFDDRSEYIPSLAGLYFSNSQNDMDNKYIVEYLIKFADQNPEKNWRWYSTASYLAHFKLNDDPTVKEVSKKLLSLSKDVVPLWARVLGIFMMKKSDICSSIEMIMMLDEKEIDGIANDKVFGRDNEKNFFLKLIGGRLEEIKNNPDAAKKCFKNFNKPKKAK